jgi:signal transduction histidine kinase
MLSALHSIAATTSRSLDLDWVLRAVIEKITEIFRFEATQIHVADERTDELLLGAYFETEPNRFAAVRSFKKGQGIVGKVAESGKPLIFEDAATDPLYRQLSHTKITGQFGFRFFAVFPIRGKQNSLGTLACTGAEPRKLSSEEIQLLEALADQIAVAIENSRLYEEIRKKVQELQRQTAELERANKVKNEFLSVMSHELRTPLSVIVGYVSMVKDGLYGAINPEQDKALEKVVRRANEQLGMINTILQATQLEADEIRLNIHEIRLGEFFADLKSGYEIPLDKEVALTWDYPSDLPVLKTDGDKLRHILQNLIGNAIKFTAKGSVTISARVTGINSRFVEFKVADTGIGISDADLHAIFDKFRQVDSSETRKYGGVGIGLYIVKTFVELLGGGIGVESEVAKGTTFTVRIPLPAETKAVRRDAEPHESKIEQLHQQ